MQTFDTSCRRPNGFPSNRFAELDSLASIARWRSGEEVYCQDAPIEHWYRMISGAARRYTMRRNGRREIVDFLLPGNFFGFAHQTQHAFTVEAIVDATYIARYPITPIESMLDPLVVRSVWEATTEETRRLQVRILTLAQLTALERVASFLLEMLVRSPEGPDRILLPMSRYDIADYLAVSVETVCRALTRLKDRGAITFGGTRHIRIADRGLLGNCGAEYPMTILQTLR